MTENILHQGAIVQCAHQGPAEPMTTYSRVTVSGQQIVVQANQYSILGCQFPAWTAGASPPCATASWTTAAQRVFAGGVPIVLFRSQSVCQPNGTPLTVLQTQMRVAAS